MTVRFGVTELEWLLQHELEGAKRYRHYVSLAFFSNSSDQGSFFDPLDMGPAGILQHTVRSTDAVFHCTLLRGAVILSETSGEAARKAVSRWIAEQKGNADFRFGLASFPEMNGSAGELMRSALDRLRRAETNTGDYLVCDEANVEEVGRPWLEPGRQNDRIHPGQEL